jgi:hypothetical protein
VKYASVAIAPAKAPHTGARAARVLPYQDATIKAAISASMIAARLYIT